MLSPAPVPQAKPFLAAAAQFAGGNDTPRAYLERCLDALAAWEPKIGAFVHTNVDGARAAADASSIRWRDNKSLSAIDGMPVGIKDIIETADMPTEMGSPLFDGWCSGRDAAAVAALREAGAVILGKTVTTEFAATEPRGTRNPWDLARTPGGSSSGSGAAVAAGLVSAALGTQVQGSIVRPASYCGCVGFKPSVGSINRGGSHDELSQSCMGVLAATLEDAWQVASEIAARAGGDPGYPGLVGPLRAPPAVKPRRLVFLETAGWQEASAEAKQALQEFDGPLDAGRHRHCYSAVGQTGRCRGAGDRQCPLAVDPDQHLGIALAAQHLSQPRCGQVEPRNARAARASGGNEPQRLSRRSRRTGPCSHSLREF